MKIVYDISVLAAGHFTQFSKTGVARVTEQLLHEMIRRDKHQIYFSAHLSADTLYKAKRYLAEQDILDANDLLYGGGILEWVNAQFFNRYITGRSQIYARTDLMARIERRLLANISKFLRKFGGSSSVAYLRDKDIFHTNYYAFPEFTENLPRLKRFMTIYDLIPIIYPEYFKYDNSSDIRNALCSIRPQDGIFAISECTKNDICSLTDISPERIRVTYLAASDDFYRCTDTAAFAEVQDLYGIPEKPYILSVCTLEPRKNIELVIKSFYSLVEQERIEHLHLVLVGAKGWGFDKIFDEIDKRNRAAERILVTGFVADEHLAAIYSNALMFVYPSFYEGFGLPPLEAMQCGVPVVTSNTSSLPEVVGDAGIMVDPTDGDSLTQAMLDLYKSEVLRSELSAKGLDRASRFSWTKCADETLQAYQEME